MTPKHTEDHARSEDLISLLNSIAWTDTIAPALENEKQRLQNMMVASVLGTPVIGVGGRTMTPEQLAGMCYGMDFITRLFRDVLLKGERAIRELEREGYHPTQQETKK